VEKFILKTEYSDILSASKGLLLESCKLVNTLQEKYVVIGGWSPYLRNDKSYTGISHPGTKDVDLLFFGADAEKQLGQMISLFLKNDYYVSAKHDFQLLRVLKVKDRELVFNIDLLHPVETLLKDKSNMYVDHFDLGIPERLLFKDEPFKQMKSIALPSSKFILEDDCFKTMSIKHDLPLGGVETVDIPIVDEAGMILSKCKSVSKVKRERDAFDIFLSLKQKGKDNTINKLKTLCNRTNDLKDLVTNLKTFASNESDVFNTNVSIFMDIRKTKQLPSDYVLECISKIV
jgi:hypothetical protein